MDWFSKTGLSLDKAISLLREAVPDMAHKQLRLQIGIKRFQRVQKTWDWNCCLQHGLPELRLKRADGRRYPELQE